MFNSRPKEAIDIDLSAFGLPNPRENTLAALKKRAETTHSAAPGGASTHAGAGVGQPGGHTPVGRPAAPPKPALGAALDELAHVGRAAGGGGPTAPRPPPGGPSSDLDSLLHGLSGLAPPSGPRAPPQTPSRSTPAPASGEAFYPHASTGTGALDDLFGAAAPRSHRGGPPAPALHPRDGGDLLQRSGSHVSMASSSGAAAANDDLDSFFAGGMGAPAAAQQPSAAPPDHAAPLHQASPPTSVRATPAGGGGGDDDDFFSGGSFNEAAAAAAASLTQHRPSRDDDFFSGGGGGGAKAGGAAAPAPRPHAGSSSSSSGGHGGADPPSHGGDASSDLFDVFLSSARAATGPGGGAPAPQVPLHSAGGGHGGRRPGDGSHHTPASSISSLDELASFVETSMRTGGGGGVAPSSDPLHDVVFGSPTRAPRPTGSASSGGSPVHKVNPVAPAATATSSSSAPHVHVSDADVMAAMGTDLTKQHQREDEEAVAADPNEPEERKQARRRRHEEARSRVEAAVREKLARDAVAAAQAEERHAVSDAMGPKLEAWTKKGKGNIRLYLATVQDVLWEGNTWKPIGLTDLVAPAQVKKAWMKVLVNIHPDKVQQRGGTTTQRFVADKVFHVMLDAYNAFAAKEL